MREHELLNVVLQIDLHAKFDDPTWRQTEVRRSRASVARDEGEEGFTPTRHVALTRREQRFTAQVVARVAEFDVEAVFFASEQHVGHVRRLHEAVTSMHAEKPLALILDRDAFVWRNLGYALV